MNPQHISRGMLRHEQPSEMNRVRPSGGVLRQPKTAPVQGRARVAPRWPPEVENFEKCEDEPIRSGLVARPKTDHNGLLQHHIGQMADCGPSASPCTSRLRNRTGTETPAKSNPPPRLGRGGDLCHIATLF
jgi:hypothetical protein